MVRLSAKRSLVSAAVLCVVVLAPVSAYASVTLTSYPQEMVCLRDRLNVVWEEQVRCYIAYGPAPGTYTDRTVTEAVGEMTFVPEDEGMQPGVHFCVVREVGGGDSEEFQLVVQSPVFPEPSAPPNGGEVSETTVLLEWDPVDRVPYYHVVVSDSEIEISEEGGELALSGVNIIWQAITSGNSIQYGGPDPSGHFEASNGVSPPLMSGFDYNWLVFNNYGNHPLLTSVIGAGISGYSANIEAGTEAPFLLEPPDGTTSAEGVLTFDWTDSPGASGYHVYMHERRDWAGGEASYPVWDAATTLSEIDVHLGDLLTSGEYYWRVVALDGVGAGACSESRRLDYETETGQARILTRDEQGFPLPWTYVEIEFTSGGVEVLPAITNEDGVYTKTLVPGEYSFLATKDGHVDTLEQATVWVDQTTTVELSLRRAPARIRGIVEDELGRPVFDARVATSAGQDDVSARSDADGNFVLTVEPGDWTIVASKNGYEPSLPTTATVQAGDYHVVDSPLVLWGTPGTLSGTVVNSSGNPLPAATIWADGVAGQESATTDGAGGFALELAPGVWEVRARKSGFQNSEARVISVPPGGDESLDPPIALSPVAASVSGRVTDGLNVMVGARVVAVPRAGEVCETWTNSHGEFVLLPQPADYRLVAFADGHAPSEERDVTVDPYSAFTNVALEVRPLDSVVAGRVTDGSAPVPGVVVSNGRLSALTRADGTFSLDLPRGVHEISTTRPGYFPDQPVRVATAPGQELQGLSLRVAEGACSASGLVLNEGAPVPGAWVRAGGPSGAAACISGDDGSFELAIEAGTWLLTAGKDGFAQSLPETLLVAEGQTASGISLRIEDNSATIRGFASDGAGPVRKALVQVYAAGSSGLPVYRTTTNSSGVYSIAVAPDDGYTLRVGAEWHGTVDTSVPDLAPGQTAYIDVALPRYEGLVEGVVSSGGEHVMNAGLTAVWGDSVSVTSDRLGRFSMWLDDGIYDVRAAVDGYETVWSRDVEVVSGEATQLLVELPAIHARLTGSVGDSLTAAPVEGALVTATWPGGGASWIAGPDGDFELGSIVPGNVSLHVRAPGYRAKELSLSLGESEHATLTVDLLELDGVIGGAACLDSSDGLPGVLVRARLDGEVVSTAATGADGRFLLTELDPARVYELRAVSDGHYCVSENPLAGVETGTLDASFTFSECTGRLSGLVVDAATGEPLAGAAVTADDGEGHFGQVSTDENGAFEFSGLVPTGDYTVAASLFGYHDASISAPPGTEGIELSLPRNFARVTGTVSVAGGDVILDDVVVVATSTSYAVESRSAAPDAQGAYDVHDIRPGTYLVSAAAEGCLATPAQVAFEFGEGEVVSGLDFTVEKAVVERVEVGGPASVAAGGSAVFTADAIASGNRVVDLELDWRVSPPQAGAVARSSGAFSSSDDYIGEATVSAAAPNSRIVGRHSFSVFAQIDASTEATFSDSTGMSLTVTPGAVDGARSMYLSHERVPYAKCMRSGFEVAAISYVFKPAGLTFAADDAPLLRLPSASDGGRVVRWNEDELEWVRVETSHASGALEGNIDSLGEYAVARSSRPLGISGLEAEPDPFSPEDGPVTITYELSSTEARMPFVTVRVYNMAAQLVRVVVENEPQAKGRSSVEWDGLTDDREKARNGRYVIEVTAEDASGVESELATVVLVK